MYCQNGETGSAILQIGIDYNNVDRGKHLAESNWVKQFNWEIRSYGIQLVWLEKQIPAFLDEEGKPVNAFVTETTLCWAKL